MKRFLTNLLVFLVLLSFSAIILVVISDLAMQQRKEKLLRIQDNITVVLAGDSNIESSLNDSLIDNSINIAQSGECYIYSYAKIRSLLEYNRQIKTVCLGFSYRDLIKQTEELWMYEIIKISFYNYLLGFSDRALLLRNNPVAYCKGIMQSIVSNAITFRGSLSLAGANRRIVNFGGYVFLVRDKLQEAISRFSERPFEKGLIQEKYLKLISEECARRSVRLILLNTPKHSYYRSKLDGRFIQNWQAVRNELPNDSLLDLSDYNLPDSCFADLDHLNYRGARIFSEYINSRLNSDLKGN